MNEGNYAEVHGRLGSPTYWWPKVRWPKNREQLVERPVSETTGGVAVPETSNFRECSGEETGYLPLQEAVNLLTGQPEGSRMNRGNPSWWLWEAALSARQPGQGWPVRRCRRDDGIGNDVTFVHVGDFLTWAQERAERGLIPEECELWTPDALTEERGRLQGALNRLGVPLVEQDEAKRRIKRAEDLLRRCALVGLKAQVPQNQPLLRAEIASSQGAPQPDATESVGLAGGLVEIGRTESKARAASARRVKSDNTLERGKALVAFSEELYSAGNGKGLDWAMRRAPFPFTRKDFLAVFWHNHKIYKKRVDFTIK